MRIRSLVVAALLVPSIVSAQRRMGGRIGTGRVAPPASLPPQPGSIAKGMRYVRLPISSESYFFVSYMQGPMAPTNITTSFGALGAATRLDYRVSKAFSVTTDITQTLYAPIATGTIEGGMRFRPA